MWQPDDCITHHLASTSSLHGCFSLSDIHFHSLDLWFMPPIVLLDITPMSSIRYDVTTFQRLCSTGGVVGITFFWRTRNLLWLFSKSIHLNYAFFSYVIWLDHVLGTKTQHAHSSTSQLCVDRTNNALHYSFIIHVKFQMQPTFGITFGISSSSTNST